MGEPAAPSLWSPLRIVCCEFCVSNFVLPVFVLVLRCLCCRSDRSPCSEDQRHDLSFGIFGLLCAYPRHKAGVSQSRGTPSQAVVFGPALPALSCCLSAPVGVGSNHRQGCAVPFFEFSDSLRGSFLLVPLLHRSDVNIAVV